MPIKNFLKPEQVSKLQQALRESESPHLRERILMFLLQNDGKTYEEVASFLGCSPRTVAYWCVHGEPDNLDSLRNQREQEHYRKVTTEYLKILLETVEKEPQELGYEFGRWTGERLATYLAEQTGIKVSGSQISQILKRKKSSYIWAKSSLESKQNPGQRTEFIEKLTRYLAINKEKPEHLQVWFWDETGFSLRVIRRKNWGKKGKRKKITGQGRRGRVNVMGGMREHDRKRLCFFIEKGNADSFYEQLHKLNDFVTQEWISKGNQPEEFKNKGPKIVIILDNASYHKRLDIQDKINKEFPNISLEFLPAYSPDMNIIELVWHSCKEYIAHRLFQSVDELKALLERLLNQGDLVINWQRKIKNKGDAFIAT